MNPVRFWFGILAILGFVVVTPAWLYFAGPAVDGLPPVVQWLTALLMPFALLLTLASWMQTAS